ncbi:MAG: hypothetical protein WC413_01410 [Candidatus Nanoarchaeia archaeon]
MNILYLTRNLEVMKELQKEMDRFLDVYDISGKGDILVCKVKLGEINTKYKHIIGNITTSINIDPYNYPASYIDEILVKSGDDSDAQFIKVDPLGIVLKLDNLLYGIKINKMPKEDATIGNENFPPGPILE